MVLSSAEGLLYNISDLWMLQILSEAPEEKVELHSVGQSPSDFYRKHSADGRDLVLTKRVNLLPWYVINSSKS